MKNLELSSVLLDIKSIVSQNDAPVKRVGVFGSLVRGQINDNSDIDIAIEYDPGVNNEKYGYDSMEKFFDACELLAEKMAALYGRQIDVVPVEERNGCLLDDIRGEVVWV